jgi:hypothetical protein
MYRKQDRAFRRWAKKEFRWAGSLDSQLRFWPMARVKINKQLKNQERKLEIAIKAFEKKRKEVAKTAIERNKIIDVREVDIVPL